MGRPPPIALTMGEPAGIGGEIALKAWLSRADDTGVPAFFLIDDPERIAACARTISVDAPIEIISEPAGTHACFERGVPVLPLGSSVRAHAGQPDGANARAVIDSIERAVEHARTGEAAGLVTNPIHKAVLYDAGFAFAGHTEFLAHLEGPNARATMMLAVPGLRVVPVTIHLPLHEAPAALSVDAIEATALAAARALERDFGIASPRLAIAALNPHGGEDGALGREEIEVIAPAVAALKRQGIDAAGPAPADTLFHDRARARYDAVVCMYHDQALIPLKTIDFDHGVNITIGLPFVRTSPDHGTALNIAGTGTASPASLIAALRTAAEIARNRHRHAGAADVA